MDPVPVVTTLAKTMSVKEATSKLTKLRCELRQMERAAKTLENIITGFGIRMQRQKPWRCWCGCCQVMLNGLLCGYNNGSD